MVAQKSKRDDFEQQRTASRLGSALEKSLSAYAVTAAAAGVGVLALARSAEARIIYTPANIGILSNGGPVLLDLNHDGVADFFFSNVSWSRGDIGGVFLQAGARNPGLRNQGNEIWGGGLATILNSAFVFASALHPGFTVGPNARYLQKCSRCLMGSYVAFSYQADTNGQWLYTKGRYLGLKFMISGQAHYGWARLDVTLYQNIIGQPGLYATLTGYAYETIPNKAIITGKTKGADVVTLGPATLGRLAQGALEVSTWQEKK